MALAGALLALALATASGPQPSSAGGADVAKRLFVGGLDQPIYVARAPGVDDTIYVVERGGTVQAVVNGEVQAQPFLTIPPPEGLSDMGEGGLLSIAFDPDYQQNGLFYTYYTVDNAHLIRIAEFGTNSDTDAAEASLRRVLSIPHPEVENHQGGTIAFGPDGFLYAAPGDGGTGGQNAQDVTSNLLGKVLRIDPHQSGADPYTVPSTNPFVDRTGDDEILALGLRNPFRWSFDRRRILIGDVGQNAFEEVDYETLDSLRRANFGWRRFEGDDLFDENTILEIGHYEPPIFDYRHSPERGHVITGGIVVRDDRLTSLDGRYLYADFGAGALRSLNPQLGGTANDQAVGIQVNGPVAFNQGPRRRVYVTSLYDGKVFRLVPS